MNQEKDLSVIICNLLPGAILADESGCCTKPKADCPRNLNPNSDPKLQLCGKNTTTGLPVIRPV